MIRYNNLLLDENYMKFHKIPKQLKSFTELESLLGGGKRPPETSHSENAESAIWMTLGNITTAVWQVLSQR